MSMSPEGIPTRGRRLVFIPRDVDKCLDPERSEESREREVASTHPSIHPESHLGPVHLSPLFSLPHYLGGRGLLRSSSLTPAQVRSSKREPSIMGRRLMVLPIFSAWDGLPGLDVWGGVCRKGGHQG